MSSRKCQFGSIYYTRRRTDDLEDWGVQSSYGKHTSYSIHLLLLGAAYRYVYRDDANNQAAVGANVCRSLLAHKYILTRCIVQKPAHCRLPSPGYSTQRKSIVVKTDCTLRAKNY